MGYWLLVIEFFLKGYGLLVIGYRVFFKKVMGYWLLVIEFFLKGYGLVVIGYRILMVIAYGRKEIFV